MKKIAAIGAVVAFVFALAACGSSSGGSSSAPSVTPSSKAPTQTNQQWWNASGSSQTDKLFGDFNQLTTINDQQNYWIGAIQTDIATSKLPPSDSGGYYKSMLSDITAYLNAAVAAHYNFNNDDPVGDPPTSAMDNAFNAGGQAWQNFVQEVGLNPAPAFPSEDN